MDRVNPSFSQPFSPRPNLTETCSVAPLMKTNRSSSTAHPHFYPGRNHTRMKRDTRVFRCSGRHRYTPTRRAASSCFRFPRAYTPSKTIRESRSRTILPLGKVFNASNEGRRYLSVFSPDDFNDSRYPRNIYIRFYTMFLRSS